MGNMWRLVFVFLAALQVATSLPSPSARDDPPPHNALTSPAKVITSFAPAGTIQILVETKTPATGFIPSVLETLGHVTSVPLLTDAIPTPTSLRAAVAAIPTLKAVVSISVKKMDRDIFADPISTNAPPANIGRKEDHPAPRLGITKNGPIETNKFYGNFHLGNQTSPTYLHPYSVAWPRGQGAPGTWGLAVSHVEPKQRVYGKTKPVTGAVSYFINPVGIHSVCLSAKELGPESTLTTDSLTDFSVQVNLHPKAGASPAVQFPLVQGSGFITAIYNGARPVLETGVFYRSVTRVTTDPKPGVTKYKLQLEDGTIWWLYARHTSGSALDLEVVNNGYAQAKGAFHGTIQVAKDPGDGEKVYDQACGAYATGVKLVGSATDASGSYTFCFKKDGIKEATLVMFALPHHQSSFDGATKGKMANVKLQTTTKGLANAVLADSWTMVEPKLPTTIGFLPWSPEAGGISSISEAAKKTIRGIAQKEISQDIMGQTDQPSMYFSGKALAKFAGIILATQEMLGDPGLAQAGLDQLKMAFARFAKNEQQYPLVYENAWGGVVSSATYDTGDPGLDFGNTYYNDHHFHWGYFIYTAAVIGHLDPSWIPANKDYVNMLVRDIANPSTKDEYFPVWRCFDWFHGHSWAHGLYDTLDGKNQESSSEDTMHAYGLKMWGAVTRDENLEARANLMLAIQTRSLQSYYLYTASNTIQPAEFIGNKVAGILFENKVDHTTFFGADIELIQGIHMIPLLPHTPLVRTSEFVREEWETYFSDGRADAVQGGWKGILYANYATVDPRGAYEFFSGSGFDMKWVDGGASLTWYLCYAAALGGL